MDKADNLVFTNSMYNATIFTYNYNLSINNLLAKFFPDNSADFDGDPIIPDFPDGFPIPQEIPRITLVNKNKNLRLEISPNRSSIIYTPLDIFEQNMKSSDFYNFSIDTFLKLLDFLRTKVYRIGTVVHRISIMDDPGIFLSRHFCQNKWLTQPLNRPESFELSAHKVFLLGEKFTVNSWVRNKTGNLTTENDHKRVIVVEQDLNTVLNQNENKEFTNEEIDTFFNLSCSEFNYILNLNYPNAKIGE